MIFLRITNKPSCFLQSGFKKDKLMKVEDYKMRILFEMDKKDYVPDGSVYSRPSARAVIAFRKVQKRIFLYRIIIISCVA